MCDSLNTNIATDTVEAYLRGCCNGIYLPDETIANIADGRDVLLDWPKSVLEKMTKDLLKADVYRQICLLPSVSPSVEDADGEWKHKDGGMQLTEKDKIRFREEANNIYSMYGESIIGKSSIKMNTLGMRIWRRKC